MKIMGVGSAELIILLVLLLLVLLIVWTVRYRRKKQEEDSGKVGVVVFCPKCGNQLSGTATFCNKCGAQVQARQVQQAVENQNASEARPEPEVSAVQNQAQVVSNAVSKPPISGVRIAAIVIAMLTVCTSFMTWYVPSKSVTSSAGLVNGVSTVTSFFTGESASSISFADSYSLWTSPSLISNLSNLANTVGLETSAIALLYIPLILFVLGVVLVIVSIAKTFNRDGGKAALIWANRLFLVAYIAYFFIYKQFGSSIGLSTSADVGSVMVFGLLFAVVGSVVSAFSKDPKRA